MSGQADPGRDPDLLLARIATLDEEKRLHEREMEALASELESTNRGVVALYAELDDQAVQLRSASELKSRFLSNVSHEFRTPLNSIHAIARLLLDRIDGELTGEQERQVEYILASARSLSDLIDDLLDIAKVEAGKVEVRVAPITVTALLATLRGVLRPLRGYGSVDLVFESDERLPLLHSDEGKVSQILRNLVSNALKFTETGEVRVAVRHDPAADRLLFAVSDTGIGIAETDRERVFQEFVQIEHGMQTRVRGTGLGLPLSRNLAHLLGGALELDSAPGRGSTFTLSLPTGRPAARADGPSERPVLLIDDEPMARYVLRHSLGDQDVAIVEAEDGAAGIAAARTAHPAIIFLDLRMPGLTGFDVLERLAADAETADIPVVVITSSDLGPGELRRLSHARAILSKSEVGRERIRGLVRELMLASGNSMGVAP